MGVGHQVEMLGRLVHDDYLPKEGSAVLALLPDEFSGAPTGRACPPLWRRPP